MHRTPMEAVSSSRSRAEVPPPNVLVVVMDCVRADDFAVGVASTGTMPFCRRLRSECIEFPRAVSPGSWTLPSHASLFTGLYPWEHGLHGKGSQKLAPTPPSLAGLLRERGYRTMSLSANWHINPDRGLTQGCDAAAWGAWYENYLRFRAPNHPPFSFPPTRTQHDLTRRLRKGRLGPLLQRRAFLAIRRYPFLWDFGAEMILRTRDRDPGSAMAVAPWIEPTLDRWLEAQPRDRPVYSFINLLDSHEPYPTFLRSHPGLSDWYRYARVKQDRVEWIRGYWRPSADEFAKLHELYRGTLATIDRRLDRIVRLFVQHERWDNTLLILTSDHGQAFGESDTLFHMFRVDEPLVRIPLWLRPPGGHPAVRTATGWASLIDVPSTVLASVGNGPTFSPEAVPLWSLVGSPRPHPVLTMSEGLLWNKWPDLPPERKRSLDRVEVAVYDGDWKVVVDARAGSIRAHAVTAAGTSSPDVWPEEKGRLAHLAAAAETAGKRLLSSTPESLTPEIDARLTAWGY